MSHPMNKLFSRALSSCRGRNGDSKASESGSLEVITKIRDCHVTYPCECDLSIRSFLFMNLYSEAFPWQQVTKNTDKFVLKVELENSIASLGWEQAQDKNTHYNSIKLRTVIKLLQTQVYNWMDTKNMRSLSRKKLKNASWNEVFSFVHQLPTVGCF